MHRSGAAPHPLKRTAIFFFFFARAQFLLVGTAVLDVARRQVPGRAEEFSRERERRRGDHGGEDRGHASTASLRQRTPRGTIGIAGWMGVAMEWRMTKMCRCRDNN